MMLNLIRFIMFLLLIGGGWVALGNRNAVRVVHSAPADKRVVPHLGLNAPIYSTPSTAASLPGMDYRLVLWRVYALPEPWPYSPTGYTQPVYSASKVGDVDGDGRADVVALVQSMPDPSPNRIWVFRQQQDGTLAPVREYPLDWNFAETGSVIGLTLADINDDGVRDIVVTHMFALATLLSDGAGGLVERRFAIPGAIGVGNDRPAFAADFDLDGITDLVVHVSQTYSGNPEDFRSKFLIAYGDRKDPLVRVSETVTGKTYKSDVQQARSVAVGDFNNDGYPDLAATFWEADYWAQKQAWPLKVFFNDRSGHFPTWTKLAENIDLVHLSGGDFDGDGDSDLAAVTSGMATQLEKVFVYSQESSSLVLTPQVQQVVQSPAVVETADLNGDGLDDLLISHDGWFQTSWLLQTNGGLSAPGKVSVGNHPSARSPAGAQGVGDLNGDGCMDVTEALTYGGLNILLGEGCTRFARMSTPLPPLSID